MIDHLVVVHADHHKRRRIILALGRPSLNSLIRIPSVLAAKLLFGLKHLAQELNVPAAEEIKPTIHVHDAAGQAEGPCLISTA